MGHSECLGICLPQSLGETPPSYSPWGTSTWHRHSFPSMWGTINVGAGGKERGRGRLVGRQGELQRAPGKQTAEGRQSRADSEQGGKAAPLAGETEALQSGSIPRVSHEVRAPEFQQQVRVGRFWSLPCDPGSPYSTSHHNFNLWPVLLSPPALGFHQAFITDQGFLGAVDIEGKFHRFWGQDALPGATQMSGLPG